MAEKSSISIERKGEKLEISGQIERISSILPPPEVCQKYEELVPGYTERILTIIEKEQQSRIERTGKLLNRLTRQNGIGLALGFIVVIVVLGLIAYSMTLEDKSYTKALIWLAGVLAGIFVLRKVISTPSQK